VGEGAAAPRKVYRAQSYADVTVNVGSTYDDSDSNSSDCDEDFDCVHFV